MGKVAKVKVSVLQCFWRLMSIPCRFNSVLPHLEQSKFQMRIYTLLSHVGALDESQYQSMELSGMGPMYKIRNPSIARIRAENLGRAHEPTRVEFGP